MKFEWCWCELCRGPFIRCPKCGNNCCNATYGHLNGETCDVCELVYQYQDLASKTNQEPTKEWIENNKKQVTEIKNWFQLESERIRKYHAMTKEERIKDILNNPAGHKHTGDTMEVCCLIDGKIDKDLWETHREIFERATK